MLTLDGPEFRPPNCRRIIEHHHHYAPPPAVYSERRVYVEPEVYYRPVGWVRAIRASLFNMVEALSCWTMVST